MKPKTVRVYPKKSYKPLADYGDGLSDVLQIEFKPAHMLINVIIDNTGNIFKVPYKDIDEVRK